MYLALWFTPTLPPAAKRSSWSFGTNKQAELFFAQQKCQPLHHRGQNEEEHISDVRSEGPGSGHSDLIHRLGFFSDSWRLILPADEITASHL